MASATGSCRHYVLLCALLGLSWFFVSAQELQRKVCPSVKDYVPRRLCGSPAHQCKDDAGCKVGQRCCPNAQDCSYTCVKPRPPRGCPIPIDLALVLDSSGSIGRRNWVKVKRFAKDVIDYYDVSEKGTHIGIVMYSTDASVKMHFNKYSGAEMNNVNIKRDIDELRLERGLTFIDKALKISAEKLFTEKNGMRLNRKKVALVLTDGIQTKDKGPFTPLQKASQPMKDKGVEVYSLGIGSDIDVSELITFASGEKYVFNAKSFDELQLQVENITQAQCQACAQPVDVYFGIPTAKELGKELEDIKEFFARLTTLFQIGNRGAHIGVLRYSDTADLVIKLDSRYSRPGVSEAVRALKPEGIGFNVRKALEVASDNAFTIFGGVRQTAPKTFVLFIPGPLKQDMKEIDAAALKLKNMGVRVLMLGIKDKIDASLATTASQPPSRYFIQTLDYEELGVAAYEAADTVCKARYGKCQAFRPPPPAECPPDNADECAIDQDCQDANTVCCKGGCGRICEQKVNHCLVTMDIGIAIDTASDISDEDLTAVKSFTQNLIHALSDSENAIRFSLMQYGDTPKTLATFRHLYAEKELRGLVKAMKKSSGAERRVDSALEAMTSEVFSLEGGVRQGHPRYALFLTAGSSSPGSADLKTASAGLQKLGVNVIAVGVNSQAGVGFLGELATDSKLVFPLASSTELANLWSRMFTQMCNAKPGSCPVVTGSSPSCGSDVSLDYIPCGGSDKQSDWTCPGEQKCCLDQTGCHHICRHPPNKCKGKYDLALLIEASTFVGKSGLAKIKSFAKDLVDAFTISHPDTRIAIITYGATPTVNLKFNTLQGPMLSTGAVQTAIQEVLPRDGGGVAATTAALRLALNEVFTVAGGSRDIANKSLVIISQGQLDDAATAAGIAAQLRQKFVDVFSVTVGNNSDVTGLREIVSKPVDKNVFMTSSFGALDPNLRALTRTICEGADKVRPCGKPIDVLFGIPVSNHLGQEIWSAKSTFNSILGLLLVSNIGVHVGVIPYSETSDLTLHLDSQYKRDDIKQYISDLPASKKTGLNVAGALRTAADQGFTLFGGVRQTSPKVLVLMIPARFVQSDAQEILAAATKLKSLGARILVLGISGQVDETLAKSIASQPTSSFFVTADTYSGLISLAPKVVNTICRGSIYGKCPPPPPLPPGGTCPSQPSVNCSIDESCQSQDIACCYDSCGSSRCERAIKNCFVPAEIVFALDASESSSTTAFADMKGFVMDVVRSSSTSENNQHYGILKYSSIASPETRGFRNFRSESELKEILDKMDKTNDPVKRVDLALRTAKREFFSPKGGMRFGHPRYLIFLTSSPITAGHEDVGSASADLKELDVNIVAVATDSGVEPAFLQSLATEPRFVFKADSSAGLKGLVGDVTGQLCHEKPGKCPPVLNDDPAACASIPSPSADLIPCGPSAGKVGLSEKATDWDCPGEARCCRDPQNGCHSVCVPPPLECKKHKDILFMVETTEQLGEEGFEKIKTFTKQIIDAFAISSTETQVAFMTFHQRARVNVRFNSLKGDLLDKKNLFEKIDNIKYSPGRFSTTYRALQSARTAVFTKSSGSRENTNKTVVIFSTGRFENPLEASQEAYELRGEHVDVFAVPIGKNPDVGTIRDVVSLPTEKNIFMMTSAAALKPQLRALVSTICRGALKQYQLFGTRFVS
ncbi:uncharacterized protein LOC5507629 isoform X2 [Nematostella vectensis]|uniref:uncharacterized protein LOC5507629 isoform X2 n=1 Tax=Nematostella vectensis TaxID=45351 RepID=UPI00207742A3|nr:uncharacterized protein LOC5507629 isoform X2 [Nematostella vectensis]XP_048583232.1 uncharacterized protein LOC5507629 isoform X2 [Nematostella vectensis]